MPLANPSVILPIAMLAVSNVVMNLAWYGHLKTPHRALWIVLLTSWLLAGVEYALAVPANRIGAQSYSLAQLKTIQEVLSLVTFAVVAWFLFGTRPTPSILAGFAMIAGGAFLVFRAPFG